MRFEKRALLSAPLLLEYSSKLKSGLQLQVSSSKRDLLQTDRVNASLIGTGNVKGRRFGITEKFKKPSQRAFDFFKNIYFDDSQTL